MLITSDITAKIPTPGVCRVSAIGAGDSMLASLSPGREIMEAVQFGVACGTATTLNPGIALGKKKDAQLLFKEVCKKQSLAFDKLL